VNSQWSRYTDVENFNNHQYEIKNLLFPTEETAMLLYQDNKNALGIKSNKCGCGSFCNLSSSIETLWENEIP